MPQYRHPRADDSVGGPPPSAVHVSRGETVAVDADGTFEAPERIGRAIAQRYGETAASIRVEGTPTCDAIKSDGEVCGRDLPCRYHSED